MIARLRRSLVERFDRFLFGPVAGVRPYLMAKGLLLLLGLDCIVDLASHGGRYGVGGFNVAHFAVLDAVLPPVTPGLYVGSLFAISILAFVLVFGRLRRSLLVVLTGLYTLAWASSLLDAYQHHYLISLLLLSMCAFPMSALREVEDSLVAVDPGVDPAGADEPARSQPKMPSKSKAAKQRAARPAEPVAPALTRGLAMVEAPAYVSFLVTCVLVYAFTALTKLDPDWRNGAALTRIVDPVLLDELLLRAAGFGYSQAEVYAWLARGAIAIQLVCAVALGLASVADRLTTGRRLGIATLVLAPLAFHAGADAMHLEIGWFSRYMVLIALVALLPHEALRLVVALLARIQRLGRPTPDTQDDSRFTVVMFAALAAVVTPIALANVDLPGTLGAGVVVVGCVLAVFGLELRRHGPERVRDLPLALAVAGVLAFAAVAHPDLGVRTDGAFQGLEAATVRYDFYRYVGGDRSRRGETAGAIAAYRKAYRYAPNETIRDSVEAKIRRLGGTP